MSGYDPGGGKAKLIPPNLISPGLFLSSSTGSAVFGALVVVVAA